MYVLRYANGDNKHMERREIIRNKEKKCCALRLNRNARVLYNCEHYAYCASKTASVMCLLIFKVPVSISMLSFQCGCAVCGMWPSNSASIKCC